MLRSTLYTVYLSSSVTPIHQFDMRRIRVSILPCALIKPLLETSHEYPSLLGNRQVLIIDYHLKARTTNAGILRHELTYLLRLLRLISYISYIIESEACLSKRRCGDC